MCLRITSAGRLQRTPCVFGTSGISQALLFWLFKRGFKLSSGTVLFNGYGTAVDNFDNSEMASAVSSVWSRLCLYWGVLIYRSNIQPLNSVKNYFYQHDILASLSGKVRILLALHTRELYYGFWGLYLVVAF